MSSGRSVCVAGFGKSAKVAMKSTQRGGVRKIEPTLKAKPFLRWAGSKRKQVHRLSQFWSTNHIRYIEPFAGSACLFFELAPRKAILGDSNKHLIEVYRIVRDAPDQLYDRLRRIKRDEKTYYKWRKKSPNDLDTETRVLRFIYLNRNCFNGIFRTNMLGEFNVPFGKRPGAYFSREDLQLCSSLLKSARFITGDFSNTLEHVKAGDFVYLDPPFALKSRRVFRHYGASLFSTDDVPRLSASLQKITELGADFLVSYADCTEARGLAKDWNAARVSVRRHVAGFAGSRRMAFEWLISNLPMEGRSNYVAPRKTSDG